jgi:hypothetical protein
MVSPLPFDFSQYQFCAVHPLVPFYNIYWRKGVILSFSSVLNTTWDTWYHSLICLLNDLWRTHTTIFHHLSSHCIHRKREGLRSILDTTRFNCNIYTNLTTIRHAYISMRKARYSHRNELWNETNEHIDSHSYYHTYNIMESFVFKYRLSVKKLFPSTQNNFT